MKQKQRLLESPSGSHPEDLSEEAESQCSEYEGAAEPRRTPRREWCASSNSNDFRVNIPKFEGKLNPGKFIKWLYTIE